MSVEQFVRNHLELLELERQEELEASKSLLMTSPKSLEEKGVSIRKLTLDNTCTGLFGDTVLEFSLANPNGQFPNNSLSSGDIIGVYDEGGNADWNKCLVSGVLTKISARDVSIAVNEATDINDLEGASGRYRLVKLASDVTYKRIKHALTNLEKQRSGPGGHVIDIFFGEAELSTSGTLVEDLQMFNTKLDLSQQEAVAFSLSQRDVGIVHGPPGTGKTTVVVEVVRQEVLRGSRLLVCAPSNIAVDNLIERLAGPLPPRPGTSSSSTPLRMVRLGHPARAMSHLQRFTLDAQLAVCDQRSLIQEARSELNNLWKKGGRRAPRDVLRREATGLRKELRERETKALREIFKSAQIVFSTLTSLWTKKSVLDDIDFDVVVIDECSQSIEAACWLPIPRGKKCILAGDHKQLPPTVVSKVAASRGLDKSLMERLLKLYPGPTITRMLTCQYRMHTDIMTWSSQTFYESRLTADRSVATHTISDLECVQPDVLEDDEILSPLVFIDTDGCDLYELEVDKEMSKGNLGEVDLVSCHVTSLLEAGIPPGDIGIITPYNLQAELIRLRLIAKDTSSDQRGASKVEVHSVDGFQGREKEAIVISMVRSNKKGVVGFLSEHRRLNVAITRARRHLCIIGDSHTIGGSGDDVLKSLIDYLTTHANLRTAHEYIVLRLERPRLEGVKLASPGDEVGCTPVPQNLIDKVSSGATKTSAGQGQQNKKKKKDRPRGDEPDRKPPSARLPVDPDREVQERSYYTEVLQGFVRGQKEEHHFAETLTARDRAIVHEVADTLNLVHISVGEGKQRHLTIRRQPESQIDESTGSHGIRSAGNSNSQQNDDIQKSVTPVDVTPTPSQPKESTRVRPAPPTQRSIPSSANSSKATKKREQHAEKLPSKVKPNPIEAVPEDDFDALLLAARRMDGVCNMQGCRILVRTLGEDCRHCSRRFCLSHHQPEVHGCNVAAHIHARRQVRRDGEVRQGSGAVNHLPNAVRRRHLERRLDSKLTEMETIRNTGKPKKKK